MRIYDPRVGRFLSVDPLSAKYPFYTPYAFAGNKPIRFIDRDGEEEEDVGGDGGFAIFNLFLPKKQQLSLDELIKIQNARTRGAALGSGMGILMQAGFFVGGTWVVASGESISSVLAAALGDPVAAFGGFGAAAGYGASKITIEKNLQLPSVDPNGSVAFKEETIPEVKLTKRDARNGLETVAR